MLGQSAQATDRYLRLLRQSFGPCGALEQERCCLGGARHSGVLMLRRYATKSALLDLMARLSAVSPFLQGR